MAFERLLTLRGSGQARRPKTGQIIADQYCLSRVAELVERKRDRWRSLRPAIRVRESRGSVVQNNVPSVPVVLSRSSPVVPVCPGRPGRPFPQTTVSRA